MSILRSNKFNTKILPAILAAFLLNVPHLLMAQKKHSGFLSVDQWNNQFVFKRWKVKGATGENIIVSQWSIPVTFNFYFGNRGSLSIHTAPASSAYHVKRGVSQKLRFTDLSDVKINGSYLIGDQEWLLTFGINLPIGDERLNDSEFIVANVIAEDALDFPLSLYGAGYEANVGFFRAFNLGNSTIGVGASYFLRGDFQFLDGDSTSILKPGDEITGTIGLNWKIPNGNINMDFYFTNRMHDKLRNIKVFEPGNKIVLNFSTVLKRYPFAFQFWIINRWKFGSKLAPSLQDFDFIREDLNKNPHQIELGTTLIHEIFNMSMTILYSLDLKKFAKNDAGSEDAFVYGGGIGFRLNPIEWLNLGATFKYYDGYLTSLGENFELSGFQVSGVLRFSF